MSKTSRNTAQRLQTDVVATMRNFRLLLYQCSDKSDIVLVLYGISASHSEKVIRQEMKREYIVHQIIMFALEPANQIKCSMTNPIEISTSY